MGDFVKRYIIACFTCFTRSYKIEYEMSASEYTIYSESEEDGRLLSPSPTEMEGLQEFQEID